MNCGRHRVGYEGQRYEVHALTKESNEDFVLGWTERADGGALFNMALLHPSYHSPRVVEVTPDRAAQLIAEKFA